MWHLNRSCILPCAIVYEMDNEALLVCTHIGVECFHWTRCLILVKRPDSAILVLVVLLYCILDIHSGFVFFFLSQRPHYPFFICLLETFMINGTAFYTTATIHQSLKIQYCGIPLGLITRTEKTSTHCLSLHSHLFEGKKKLLGPQAVSYLRPRPYLIVTSLFRLYLITCLSAVKWKSLQTRFAGNVLIVFLSSDSVRAKHMTSLWLRSVAMQAKSSLFALSAGTWLRRP